MSIDALHGVAHNTFAQDSTNTAQPLTSVELDSNVNEALITAETDSIRMGFGGVMPTQGASPVGLKLDPGASLKVSGRANIDSLRFISETAHAHGTLQVIALVV